MFEINGKIRKKIIKCRYNYFVEIFLVFKSLNFILLFNVLVVEVYFVFFRNLILLMVILLNVVLLIIFLNIIYSK